jgi:mono/diheme cytochrome c family protein
MGRFLIGVILGILLVPAGAYAWLHYGKPPVAVSDAPLPFERQIVDNPLDARIDRELIKTPPIQPDEGTLVDGAQIYKDQCASCHGMHGKPSTFGAHMYPDAPPLFEMHHHGSESMMGVTDDPPGETYWKVANGIRLTGMPSFKDVLSDTQMWQVSLLLANADKPLPPAAIAILNGTPQPAAAPAAATPAPAPAAPAAK